ncbi:hypothetical protein A1O7_03884 [Cladophialophora yegresii CBS 114405]|uniref:Major facilitator superfamily (MFS) profile domain-containing protein n=1 Tax=Cladophialophora yegresii CBS 114405 TaxID=1182544 RepID=W9VVD3_9EURO|nr:uncharacterized protein A1O7_03884 [Cladophialophora yegresii CBS 114405]EXJ59737.1 hypothetical protein A1O7_03884 [Cladophialophora yegresii CBS 114405]
MAATQVCPVVGTTNTVLPPKHPDFDINQPGQVCPVTKATTDHHHNLSKHPGIFDSSSDLSNADNCPALTKIVSRPEQQAMDEAICPVVGTVSSVLPPNHPSTKEAKEGDQKDGTGCTPEKTCLVLCSQNALLAVVVSVSVVDSVLLGYHSSLMGSLKVMPTHNKYFKLTIATNSLNTAISYVGGSCAALVAGFVVAWLGRWKTIMHSCILPLIGPTIQAAAQKTGMFIGGRFVVGIGLGLAQTACPTYVAETAPPQHRAVALGLYYASWGVGTACCIWSLLLDATLFLHVGMENAQLGPDCAEHSLHALEVLAAINANGDKESPVVLVQYREITDTIAWEKSQQLSWEQALSAKGNRKRIVITSTFPIIVMLPGTNIITFYFGDMLSQAGITNPTTQLEINIILTCSTLAVSLLGKKTLCLISLAGQIVTFYILAGLTALYGDSSNKSGIYGTIAMIFLYSAAYAYIFTPLTVLYPPEVLSYSLRSVGMGLYTLTTKLRRLLVTMAFPFALNAIGWKTYIINASADIVMPAGVMWYWVETRGRTLEETDKLFDGGEHSDVPGLEGRADGEVEVGNELLKNVASRVENQDVVITKE